VRLQRHAALGDIDVGHLDLGIDRVARAHGREELQRLAEIDGAVTGKLFADDRGDQPRGQHAMGDAALEDGVLRVGVVEVHRVPVGGDLGEHLDILIRHLLPEVTGHAHLDVFDADRSAWQVVQHLALHEHPSGNKSVISRRDW
jgi:hypothetical protein